MGGNVGVQSSAIVVQGLANLTIKKSDIITKLSRLLKSNSIHANLNKGYSILTDNNKIIKRSIKTHKGRSIKAKLYEGELELIVKKTN